jgi:cytochrome c-type biogenesis protein CcmH
MSRPLLPLAGVAAVAAAGLVAITLLSTPAPVTDVERTKSLSAQLRCPDCQALSVAESRTRAADSIRAEIAELVAAGRSDDEIRAHFVDRYGQWILLAPPDPLAWGLPVLVVLAAIAAFGAWLARGRPGSAAGSAGAPEPDARRIREEVEALDG